MSNPLIKLNLEKIDKLIADGYIKKSVHPDGSLSIYNYTEKAVYEKYWIDETLQCRGMIADNDGNIISRPFPKFFNLGENGIPIPDEPFEVYEKLDGSLGVTYFHNGEYHIASRGSFVSPQAVYATKMLRESRIQLCEDVTYLFEIIYPGNRIVVDYGSEESLNLIGVIDTASGFEYRETQGKLWAANFWPRPFKIVKKYDGIKDIESLKKLNEKNKEGFVLHFESGLRVKFKFDEYIKLHAIIAQMTKRKVWEQVREGNNFYEFIKEIPDELYEWIRGVEKELTEEYCRIEKEAKISLGEIIGLNLPDRKSIAQMISKCQHKNLMFMMLDGKDYKNLIWKNLEPDHEIPVIEGLGFYSKAMI